MHVSRRNLHLKVQILLSRIYAIIKSDTYQTARKAGEIMKIRVEHGEFPENEIILRCKELDEEMMEVLSLLRERSAKIICFKER